jgi:hypothetical protein
MKRTLLFLVSLLFISMQLSSQVPQIISFQSMVKNADGTTISDGEYSITFKIFNAETGGTSLWTETQTLQAANGYISAALGSSTSLNLSFEDQYWIGIRIEGEDELMPRIQLSVSPYAFYAISIADNSVNSSKIEDGSIGSVDLNQMNANIGQALIWNGSFWAPTDISEGDETDPIYSASPSSSVTGDNINNWNTAYGWGDHSVVGYLTEYSETDPVYTADPASDITGDDITNWDNAFGWGNHSVVGYLTEYTETDPIFSASSAFGITGTNITNWNTAYGWGNHSIAGYLSTTTSAGGDLTGTYPNPAIGTAVIDSENLAQMGASNGDVLTWSGLNWEAQAPSGVVTEINDLTDASSDNSNLYLGDGAGEIDNGDNNNTAVGIDAMHINTSGSYNVALGFRAMYSNVDRRYCVAVGYNALNNNGTDCTHWYHGTENTAIGYVSLMDNTSGAGNTAVGSYSLRNNENGTVNTGIGAEALYSNISGEQNTATGNKSSYSNTSGNYNSSYGAFSLYNNTTGENNAAFGPYSLYSNTDRSELVAIGYRALYNNGRDATETNHAMYNNAVGYQALYNNTIGYHNSASGYQAMYRNISGNYNTAYGNYALFDNRTGEYNTAVGKEALDDNLYGSKNTAVGYSALDGNIDRSELVAIGYRALYHNSEDATSQTDATCNTAVGFESLYENTTGYNNTAIGYHSLYDNTTGSSNTAIGSYSLNNNDDGVSNTSVGANSALVFTANSYTTFLGYDADNSSSTALSNSMALGNGSRINASNQVRIGNSSVSSIGGYESWTDLSDRRFKDNLRENIPGLAFITKLRPVSYNMKVQELNHFLNIPDTLNKDERLQEGIRLKESINYNGFIAQEVEEAAKSIGFDFHGVDAPQNDETPYGLRYALFVVPLVKAVQEQQEMIEELNQKDNEIQVLKKQVEEQNKRIQELEKLNKRIDCLERLLKESDVKDLEVGQK